MKPFATLSAAITAWATICLPAIAAPDCALDHEYTGPALRAPLDAGHFPDRFEPAYPMDETRAARLEGVVSEAMAKLSPAALTVAVREQGGASWSTTRTQDGSPPPDLFYWASVGKSWTALAIMQLVEEGAIGLDQTIETWAPEFPNASSITIDDLLTHVSGLYSFQEDPALRERPGYKSAEEVLAVARAHEPLFCPGANWSYSNTGYVLLGEIIEAVDARPLAQVLTARIADRLDAARFLVLGPDQDTSQVATPAPAGRAGGTADDIRTPGAAGPVAASAVGMTEFWASYLAGAMSSPEAVGDQFAMLYPMFGQPQYYGRGVMVYDLPPTPNTSADLWLGHSGGMPGVKAVVAWSTRTHCIIAVAVSGDAPAEAIANRLLAALD